MYKKWGAKLSGKIEEGEMLVPRPSRGWNKKTTMIACLE